MNEETPKQTRRGLFPVIAVVVVLAAVWLFTQNGLMNRTSVNEQRVEVCMSGYRTAHTAADTAAVDAQVPPSNGKASTGQGKTCEYFRKAGMTK